MRPPPSSAVRRAVAAACLPLLVGSVSAGCSGGDEPPEPIIDQQAVTSEATPSPTPSATPAPDPWKERTKAGAVAFVKHWVELHNAALITGRTDALEEVSGSRCVSCNAIITALENLYEAGGSIRGEGFRILQIGTAVYQSTRPVDVAVRVEATGQVVIDAEGKRRRNEAQISNLTFELTWSRDRWRVTELERA